MATNTNAGSRKGMIKKRTQVYNPATGNYIKRDAETGQFMSVKKDGSPYKGVKKEKPSAEYKMNPSVSKATARKAEKAVISLLNKRSKSE